MAILVALGSTNDRLIVVCWCVDHLKGKELPEEQTSNANLNVKQIVHLFHG